MAVTRPLIRQQCSSSNKIYVEMADQVSQRRGLTNTFFLTLNTAIFTAVGLFWEHKPNGQVWWLAFPLAMLLGECFAWFYLLRSYRLLNTAKYEVVGALERRLPASPCWRAEWTALGAGKDRRNTGRSRTSKAGSQSSSLRSTSAASPR